ncbi:phosphoenolpyruvate carboxykinase (ATP) [Nocardiopsis metallicus]|uniref:HPr kinase n=1 Tax=Nocardiopsis metallicus TaxID=179819 RepID=A0A840WN83_9ACTN|nr:hypothetical protein [Nocardiopsis metallicus]MBB5493215.1 hypothetical protein [Nocardiopsis metallicus]
MSLRLTYLDTRVDVRFAAGSDLTETLRFLGSHVTSGPIPPDGPAPLATLYVAAEPARTPPPDAAWTEGFVRRSASDFFTVPARLASARGLEYVECHRSGTRFVFDAAERRIDVTVTDRTALEPVELLRELFLKDQENRGAVVLHATAAHRGGTAVLVVGAKGSGKSTVLLELVEHHGHEVMSGDKTVARRQPDGSLLVSGWPDYPHLGYGTIAKYPGLAEIAGATAEPEGHAFSPYGKYAVDPLPFRERFPSAAPGLRVPARTVLYPGIGPGPTRLTPVAGDAETLAANTESAFDGPRWHTFLPDLRDRWADSRAGVLTELAALPSLALTGEGDLAGLNLP